ncbi:leucine twenty homeobox [Homo sapiens]|uniref:Paired-like homeodomain transcription factor LEUTX n=2 Tax=Homo sapiens TaxID=9606 RepID=LEUTX_HUMAN|nr:paired-like homeodomain transcription factor LEUTX isoform 1 [Homo sapiens]A8MZ59.4 RecName: Full=Paired-like homeodomain transcription factor LEUTX; AltName: Full=Leucine-twenty homeobox; AltName: Full=Paired-like homeobox transcription factor LEUTX; Short=PRD-LIKE homeobox transcription factor LEUTX [Homo sapiens]KAI2590983.1 leucine twenty homeobox [Homo sapiens]KAI4042644.1 leucine twenty homeobox [Homo sapiens]
MFEGPRRYRRPRTRFLSKQLTALRELLEKTMHPSLATMGKLASKLQLDLSVVKIWFKNQRAKWKRQQRQQMQTRPSLGPANQTTSVKKEETPSAITTANIRPVSPGISDANDHDLREPSGIKNPGGASASARVSSWDSQSYDIEQICLGASNPPWASTLFEIDEFVKIYDLPGEDDTSSLNQYLFPVCLEYDQLQSSV